MEIGTEKKLALLQGQGEPNQGAGAKGKAFFTRPLTIIETAS